MGTTVWGTGWTALGRLWTASRRGWRAGLVLGLLLPASAFAQVDVEPQPDIAGLVRQANEIRGRAKPAAAALLALRPGKVDATLAVDLRAKDWLAVGAWSYPEGKFNVSYTQDRPCQIDLLRYHVDGGELRFAIGDLCQAPERAALRHLNFQFPLPVKVAVSGSAAQTWLAIDAFGKREWQRVVSYRDGVLVLDITRDGSKRDKQVKFREVRLAMPRMFSYTPMPPAQR